MPRQHHGQRGERGDGVHANRPPAGDGTERCPRVVHHESAGAGEYPAAGLPLGLAGE